MAPAFPRSRIKRLWYAHNIICIMWRFLYDKPQPFDFAAVFGAGGHDIDSCGVDAAVPQNVGKLGNVLFDAIESAGKELAQIVGENLRGRYVCGFA